MRLQHFRHPAPRPGGQSGFFTKNVFAGDLIPENTLKLLVRTRIGAWSFERIENKVLKQIPGYQIISRALKGFADEETAYPKALVYLLGSEAAVLGFVMEENDNGSVTVCRAVITSNYGWKCLHSRSQPRDHS